MDCIPDSIQYNPTTRRRRRNRFKYQNTIGSTIINFTMMILSNSLRQSSRLATVFTSKAITSKTISSRHNFSTDSHSKSKSKSKSISISSASASDPNTTVVIVDGVRLPFALSSTIYADEMAVDLQRLAFKGLVDKAAIRREDIDYVISGTVIQEVRTSNIAREAAINAGLPNSIGGHTVSMVSLGLLE